VSPDTLYATGVIDVSDAEYAAARTEAEAALIEGISGVRTNTPDGQSAFAPLAAFSLVHGLASLWNSGARSARYEALGSETLTREIGPLFTRTGLGT
jgi:hypothetical protein